MNNYLFIGKYCLTESFQTAGGKRVLNQISYLKEKSNVFIISFAATNSNIPFHKNFKVGNDRGLKFLIILIFYWIQISYIIIKRKNWKSNNVLFLESKVEINTIIPLIIAKIAGYKVVHDIVEDVNLEEEVSKKQNLTLWMSSFFMRNLEIYCNGIIVISENLFDKFRTKKLPIIKLYNSVKKRELLNIQEVNPKLFTFFYSGTFSEKDGVLDLIEAFNFVTKEHKNVKLILVGKGKGLYFEKCLIAIKNSQLIDYLGYVSEEKMFFEMTHSQVLCVTRSNSEFANNGFPFKLAEYMSFGIPIIATSVSDIPLLLSDNENVFLADASNSTSLAYKIKYVIENYSFAIKVGKNGYYYCENNFSISSIGNNLESFLKTI